LKKNQKILFDDKEILVRQLISEIMKPGDVKKFGKTLELRKDWDNIKLEVMEYGLRQKFSKKYFKEKLLETKNKELIEGNYWNDTYWGICRGKGDNNLGKLLMKIRKELQNNKELKQKEFNFK